LLNTVNSPFCLYIFVNIFEQMPIFIAIYGNLIVLTLLTLCHTLRSF